MGATTENAAQEHALTTCANVLRATLAKNASFQSAMMPAKMAEAVKSLPIQSARQVINAFVRNLQLVPIANLLPAILATLAKTAENARSMKSGRLLASAQMLGKGTSAKGKRSKVGAFKAH